MPATHSRQRALGYCLVCAAALMYALDGLLIKYINWSPMGIAGSRALFLALTLITYARGRLRVKDRRIWIGALLIAATGILYPLAVRHTTFANALILFYTTVIWIVLWEWWETGSVPRANLIALPLVVLGEAMMMGDQLTLSSGLLGNLIAVVSGFAYATAMYILILRKPRSHLKTKDTTLSFEAFVFGYLISAIFTLPWVIVYPPPADPTTLVALVLVGVVAMGIPKIFEYESLQKIAPFEVGVVMSFMEPVIGITLVYFTLGECPGPLARIGAPLVVGALLLREYLLHTTRQKTGITIG